MRFRILGPVEVRSGDSWTAVSAEKWRSLLACLLIRAGQLVPAETLIDELWGDNPPRTADNMVSIYVHRLRKLIGDTEGRVLVYRSPGYLVQIEPRDLDLQEFKSLFTAGRNAIAGGDHDAGGAALAQALRLWRGPALADVRTTPLITAAAGQMRELQLAAAELRAEADLACGRPEQVVPDLRQLVADNPLREGLWQLLMRALADAGRPAEALEAYAQARHVITEELGVDPGREMQQLYEQLLAGDGRNAAKHAAVLRSGAPAAEPPAGPARQPGGGPRDAASRTGFSRELTAARTKAGLTVGQVAQAAGIDPGQAAAYFDGDDLPGRSEAGLKTLRAVLAACAITDPEQVIAWTYALMSAWSEEPAPRPRPAHPTDGRDRSTAGKPRPVSAPAIPDAPGFDLCPDPLAAQTEADLIAALSQFRVWAGEPSFREMERACNHAAAAATICTALAGSKLPSLRITLAIVSACGGTPQHQQAFTTAWRRLRIQQNHDIQQEKPPGNRALYPIRGAKAARPEQTDPAPAQLDRRDSDKRLA